MMSKTKEVEVTIVSTEVRKVRVQVETLTQVYRPESLPKDERLKLENPERYGELVGEKTTICELKVIEE